MNKITLVLILLSVFACTKHDKPELNLEILASLGEKPKQEFLDMATKNKQNIVQDSTDVSAWLGYADAYIILHVFGFLPRNVAMPKINTSYEKAAKLDPLNSNVLKLSGIIHFLNWNWEASRKTLTSAIRVDPENLNARHWYSLWLSAMGRFDEAMAQSDTIFTKDVARDYLIGRASLFYFQKRFAEMKPLMEESLKKSPTAPWGYDWLGMAYNGLGEHKDAMDTYFKAFELSDGTVEVGAGLGHALGEAGEVELAKQMADYYTQRATTNYLPACQRAFVHLGIGENDKAMELLQQAYNEKSWFLIFIQIEHWYDPIRKDPKFIDIIQNMKFPT